MTFEFSPDWQDWLTDPYAVLGLPVTADPSRILKGYRSIAKRLHPDRYGNAAPEVRDWVTQVLARLVNPAYSKIKDDVSQREVLALVRLQALRRFKDGIPVQTDLARSLLQQPVQAAEIFYEQQVTQLTDTLYLAEPDSIAQLRDRILTLTELNAVYLQLKQGDPNLRPRRSGLLPTQPTLPPPPVPQDTPRDTPRDTPSIPLSGTLSGPLSGSLDLSQHYAQRHYLRAKHYAQNGSWKESILELKDAIRLCPNISDYHALMGFIYMKQEQPGMARVYFKQALKLNPEDKLAKRFSQYLKPTTPTPTAQSTTQSTAKSTAKKGGLFDRFRR